MVKKANFSSASYEADVESDGQNDTSKSEKGGRNRKKQRMKKKLDFERLNRTIFVGNLPNNLDSRAITKLFKPCGLVESARIRSATPAKEKLSQKVAVITGKLHSKKDSFNAYVVFKDNEDDECLNKALEMNGTLVNGHHIRVDRATPPRAKGVTKTSKKKSVFLGNLRFDLRDDELFEHFKKFGPINCVRIVRDRGTGLGKGIGFVEFKDRAPVKQALTLNGTKFKGRVLRVDKAKES